MLKISKKSKLITEASLILTLLTTPFAKAQTIENEGLKCLNKTQQQALANREKECQVVERDFETAKTSLGICLNENCGQKWFQEKPTVVGIGVAAFLLGMSAMALANDNKPIMAGVVSAVAAGGLITIAISE